MALLSGCGVKGFLEISRSPAAGFRSMTRESTGMLIGGLLLLTAGMGGPAFAAAPRTPAASITVDYPKDGSIFPTDFVAPTLEWRDSESRARSWVIEFVFDDGAKP